MLWRLRYLGLTAGGGFNSARAQVFLSTTWDFDSANDVRYTSAILADASELSRSGVSTLSMAGHDSLHVDGGLLCQEPLATEVIAGQVRQGGGHDGNTHDSESDNSDRNCLRRRDTTYPSMKSLLLPLRKSWRFNFLGIAEAYAKGNHVYCEARSTTQVGIIRYRFLYAR